MTWDLHVAEAETLLESSRIPSSLEIITLIKRINPTRLQLPEADRERGYRIKGALQNLLLEQYGEAFCLVPLAWSTEIVLIKHSVLPSVDACHAVVGALSEKALRTVAEPVESSPSKLPPKKKAKPLDPYPKDALRQAQQLLEKFEYCQAEELLSSIRIENSCALPSLLAAATLLMEEIGAYGTVIEMLLSQPKAVLKDTSVREILALAYYRNGMIPEARALFDALPAAVLQKNSLCAYAEISFKDGSLTHAYRLLEEAGSKEGFVAMLAPLKKEIEETMLAEAHTWLQSAQEALSRDLLAQAESLSLEALARYPALPKAREMVAKVKARREAEELAALWERLETSEQGAPRLDLLETLLNRDTKHKEKIARLLAAEKAAMKKELVHSRLQELREETAQERWPKCYHIIDWLSRQSDHAGSYRDACALSPNFSVLHNNRRLQKVAGKTAREAWLRWVQARSALQAGRREGCLELMEGVREYFEHYPEFAEEYRNLLGWEQESARSEIADLLQQVEGDADPLRVCTLFNRVRKKMTILPEEEKIAYKKIMQDRMALVMPGPTEEEFANAYHCALLFGNVEAAAYFREMVSDTDRLEQVEKDVSELMKLEAAPMTLTFSDDIPIDLASQSPLRCLGSTNRHIFLVDDKGDMIMADLEEMTATRFTSILDRMSLVDALPAQGIFLFRTYDDSFFARAELSSGKGAITALFDAPSGLLMKDGTKVNNIYLSSERATDYYLNTSEKEGTAPATMGRQRLRSKNGMVDAIQINDEPRIYSWRLSSNPDKFIIGATDETRICAKNLTLDVAMAMTPDIWEVDEANGHIYYFYIHMLKRVDFDFDNYVEFPDSGGCFFFRDYHRMLGLCPATNTIHLALRDKSALYDYSANKLSEPFSADTIVSTRPARKWYCFHYDRDAGELKLRDVTEEVFKILEWKTVPFKMGRTWSDKEYQELHNLLYFGYSSEDNPESSVSSQEGEDGFGDTARVAM
ncbi:hypothetical protein [Geomonas subterranea]|uniref:hypothetical protein n=1 Tax=Geomonas subterranea TaxID=2847989 RepID=UPI001CD46B0D|nr:hypothetical protein [Geomonas fuzhouensis]